MSEKPKHTGVPLELDAALVIAASIDRLADAITGFCHTLRELDQCDRPQDLVQAPAAGDDI